ncbi:MAG: SUMF1/EgtB/PvdO family nonheme iron enzyme [Rhodospirillales bacterium]
MRYGLLAVAVAAGLSVALPVFAQPAEKRVALVIGNGKYQHIGRLANPVNDARVIAQALQKTGFTLIGGGPQLDLDKPAMERALRGFGRELGPDVVGLFYYAGHGIAVRDVNYLVPVEANPQREADVDFELIDTRLVLRQMADANNRLNILILDACRNNPLAGRGFRSSGAGLAKMDAPTGTLIHYATAPGKVAADGAGANSPYTAALAETMLRPGLGVFDVFNQVGLKVSQQTRREQEPWLGLSPIQGQFYFVLPPGGSVTIVAPPAPQTAALPPRPELQIDPIDREFAAKETARVRDAPDTRGKQVATLKEGDTVLVLGKVKGQNWYQVERKGGEPGYVAAALLEDLSAFKKRKDEEAKQLAAAPAPSPAPTPAPAQPAVGVFPAPGRSFKDCVECPDMVVIPGGSFTMGSPESETARENVPDQFASRERPQHSVSIRSFALGKYEVTRGQFGQFVRESGYSAEGKCWYWTGTEAKQDPSRDWRSPGFSQSERDPVACVNWDDAKAYVAWLSRKTGKGYRLPSEAEWEHAARAGSTSARHWGEDASQACGYANVHDATSKERNKFAWDAHGCNDSQQFTAPVGSYKPNGFGLHDMLGNLWEWTEDCWNASYSGAPSDGTAWLSGDCGKRVLRGGSWFNRPRSVRSAVRNRFVTAIRDIGNGFRVARTN